MTSAITMTKLRSARRAAPSRTGIPTGDRPATSTDEGQT